MPIRVDPEGNEIRALFNMVDISGQRVLEIGSGTGRLTWRYAGRAGKVAAVEPFAPSVALAKQRAPKGLENRVEFHPVGFEHFAARAAADAYDCAILSWSL
jgi:cyclopropane fatty-acyl-phospholipid synthase-like methyltransferase